MTLIGSEEAEEEVTEDKEAEVAVLEVAAADREEEEEQEDAGVEVRGEIQTLVKDKLLRQTSQ